MEIHAYSLTSNPSVVGLQFTPPRSDPTPFHLALLLDTSGSMEGERIQSVQRTLRIMANTLPNTNALTLIEFNTSANLLCSSCSDKTELLRLVDSLKCGGNTNLEDAFLTLMACQLERPLDAICVLTDGQITQGITRTSELLSLAKRTLPERISVCTLGYGDDHNEELLKGLALQTRGTYTFLQQAEMVPVTVGTLVGAFSSEVARDVCIEWEEGDTCLEPYAGTDTKVWIGSLFAEKPQWIVGVRGSQHPLRIHWTDRAGVEHTQTVLIEESADKHTEVLEQWFRVRCLKLMEKANQVLREWRPTQRPLEDLKTLFNEMQASVVAKAPLILRMTVQLEELMDALEQKDRQPAVADRMHRRFLTRLTSNMATISMQRGVLCSEDPGNSHFFSSPTQRNVSDAFVQGYSQNPI